MSTGRVILQGGKIVSCGTTRVADVAVVDGRIECIAERIETSEGDKVIDCSSKIITAVLGKWLYAGSLSPSHGILQHFFDIQNQRLLFRLASTAAAASSVSLLISNSTSNTASALRFR